MSAGGQEDELETFRRLITQVYPSGVVSIVSDTWDLWTVLTDYIPKLKDTILNRDGKVVIRPDSGDPVKIICGDWPKWCDEANSYAVKHHPAAYGVLTLLWKALGKIERPGKLPLIDHAGAIYGDSITVERADEILRRTVLDLKLSPYNLVFGVGSFTYAYVTRDSYGFAMKATAIEKDGQIIPIFKKPVTDSGGKNSLRGIPIVYRTEESTEDNPDYFVVESIDPSMLECCSFDLIWRDGEFRTTYTFDQIRKRVRRQA